MTTSTEDLKSYILKIIYQRKLAHEKELQPLYDRLVSIESLNISPVIIANNAHVQSLLDAQKNHGTEFGTIDEIKRSTQ